MSDGMYRINNWVLKKSTTDLKQDICLSSSGKTVLTFDVYEPQPDDMEVFGDEWELLWKASAIQAPDLLPESHRKALRSLCEATGEEIRGQVPLGRLMAPESFLDALEKMSRFLREKEHLLSLDYLPIFKKQEAFLNSLSEAKINEELYEEALAEDSQGLVRSFEPNRNGFAEVSRYERFGTTTGRLIISAGPRILTIWKKNRNVLESRFQGGRILSLDYRSLEPKVLLGIQGLDNQLDNQLDIDYSVSLIGKLQHLNFPSKNRCAESDIYKWVLQELGLQNLFERDELKNLVLPIIYGAQEEFFFTQVKEKGLADPLSLLEDIRDLFGISEIQKALSLMRDEHGVLKTIYDRNIASERVPDYKLPNYWTQSTAVDVALLGFAQMFDKVKELDLEEEIRFLFVIHDAVIMDVAPTVTIDQLREVVVAAKSIWPFPENFFTLKMTVESTVAKNS